MTTPLRAHLPTLSVTYRQDDALNAPKTLDEEASRKRGITSIAYKDFHSQRVVDKVEIDFSQMGEETATEVFYKTKRAAIAVKQFVQGGPGKDGFYWTRPIDLHDSIENDLKEAEQRLSLSLPVLAEKLLSDGKKEFGIELGRVIPLLDRKELSLLISQTYLIAAGVIEAAKKGDSISQEKLAGRVSEYCTAVERELIDAKKREWADRFHLILLELPEWENSEKREVDIRHGTIIGKGSVPVTSEEGRRLLAGGQASDLCIKFGEERIPIHRDFFERAVFTREGSRENAFASYFKEGNSPREIDITGPLLYPGEAATLLPLLRDYFYTGITKCDSDVIPSLFALGGRLGLKGLQISLLKAMFGMKRVGERIEETIQKMENIAKPPIEQLGQEIVRKAAGRGNQLLELAAPIEELFRLLDVSAFRERSSMFLKDPEFW